MFMQEKAAMMMFDLVSERAGSNLSGPTICQLSHFEQGDGLLGVSALSHLSNGSDDTAAQSVVWAGKPAQCLFGRSMEVKHSQVGIIIFHNGALSTRMNEGLRH